MRKKRCRVVAPSDPLGGAKIHSAATLTCPCNESVGLPGPFGCGFAALCALCLLAPVSLVFAASAADSFRCEATVLREPEMGEVPAYRLTLGTKEYVFLPPRDWGMAVAAPQYMVTLRPSNRDATITIHWLTGGGLGGVSQARPDAREDLFKQFSNVTIKEEFPCYTGASQGKGFVLEWFAVAGHPMASRVAWVPCAGGRLEFVLTSQAGSLAAYQSAFGSLLTSFHQTSERPK